MNTYTHTMKPVSARLSARIRVAGLGNPGCASAWSGLSNVDTTAGSTWATTGFLANPRSVRRYSES